MSTLVLGIETSCDETAAAIVEDGRVIRSSIVSSQIDLHARFGGVVPELAGRAHLERITPVVIEALEGAGLATGVPPLDAVAATTGPGLVGALLVGVSYAKALSLAWAIPFVGVNHLEGHLFASFLEDPEVELPAVVLLVSGGHTLLVEMTAPGSYAVLGETVDDAAGEAFDKVARYLGLPYPGGPAIEALAAAGDPSTVRFPRPMRDDGLVFSFSGLKTAVVRHVRTHPDVDGADVAAAFQDAVVDILVTKTMRAAEQTAARSVCLAGGVAANGPLRRAISLAAGEAGLGEFLPSPKMCTDNAAMIAAAGAVILDDSGPSDLATGATPGLRMPARRRTRRPRSDVGVRDSPSVDQDTYLEHVRDDGVRLIEVARTSPSAEIPSCPRWDMRMLVAHTASVHAWAADIVANRLQARPHRRQLDEFPADFDRVAADYDASLARLLAALGASGANDLVWNWFDRVPAPAGFWFRRMSQETVIHRVDAELGARSLSPIDASLAADGIGEFLGLLQGYISREPVEGIRGSIAFSASDAEGEWRLALAPDRIEFIAGEVDATVRGPASDLYRWVMHRDDGVSALALSGDPNVIEAWRSVKFE